MMSLCVGPEANYDFVPPTSAVRQSRGQLLASVEKFFQQTGVEWLHVRCCRGGTLFAYLIFITMRPL